jgi:hypothetical protein
LVSKKLLTFRNIGTTWEEQEFPGFPDRFTIVRAKAEIKSGDGTEVALSIRQRSEPDDSDQIALQYALVDQLDYQESQVVISYKIRDIDVGKIFCAVKCDTGSTNTVVLLLEYMVA